MKKMVRNTVILFVVSLYLCVIVRCSKDVEMDIPGFEPRLVVDGFIETNMPPIVILSLSQDIFSTANVSSFLSSFVNDAQVSVHDGTNEYPLSVVCSENLPPNIQHQIKGILGIDNDSTNSFNICAYTSLNINSWGQVGKQYKLTIHYQGNTYLATTSIVEPLNSDNISLWWKEEKDNAGFGFSHATLSDPIHQYDAYKWEVKRIKHSNDSVLSDNYFRMPFNAIFDDDFFNGKTFTFYYENPWTRRDGKLPHNERGRYRQGDTAVVKLSKMNKATHDFLFSKYNQAFSSGNPFASAMNVKSNISGGALGVWAGYSPYFDTLICQPIE